MAQYRTATFWIYSKIHYIYIIIYNFWTIRYRDPEGILHQYQLQWHMPDYTNETWLSCSQTTSCACEVASWGFGLASVVDTCSRNRWLDKISHVWTRAQDDSHVLHGYKSEAVHYGCSAKIENLRCKQRIVHSSHCGLSMQNPCDHWGTNTYRLRIGEVRIGSYSIQNETGEFARTPMDWTNQKL